MGISWIQNRWWGLRDVTNMARTVSDLEIRGVWIVEDDTHYNQQGKGTKCHQWLVVKTKHVSLKLPPPPLAILGSEFDLNVLKDDEKSESQKLIKLTVKDIKG